MIDRQEILEFSRELGLSTEVLEKDNVLGWLLAGIYNHPDLKSAWLFKGGTCLKKCFFETYRTDKIQGAEATDTHFVPRYTIELTATGPVSIPPTATRAVSGSVSRPSSARGRSSLGVPFAGPKYVVECTVCGKRFTRQSYNTRLNPHKDKSGYDCYGRIGYLVDTKY